MDLALNASTDSIACPDPRTSEEPINDVVGPFHGVAILPPVDDQLARCCFVDYALVEGLDNAPPPPPVGGAKRASEDDEQSDFGEEVSELDVVPRPVRGSSHLRWGLVESSGDQEHA